MLSKTNKLFSLLAVITVWAGCVIVGQAQLQNLNTDKQKTANVARAKELVQQARAAAGFDLVQTLAFKAQSERFVKYYSVQSPTKVVENNKTLSGKIEAEFWFPERFRLKTKADTLSGFDVSYTEIMNGELAWRDPPMQVRSFGSDRRVIDVGDVERTMLMQTRTAKQHIALYTLGWMLQTPVSAPVELNYAGAVTVDGQECEAIVVDGQDGFGNILLLDSKTRLPAGLAVVFYEAMRETVVVEANAFDRRFMRDTYARARQERVARSKPPQRHEAIWRFVDYTTINGVTLPQRVRITLDGLTIEELTVNEYKINQPINPKRFEGKPEVKY